jgi:hypothetical protein
MRADPDQIARARYVDLVALISRHVKLTRHGKAPRQGFPSGGYISIEKAC